MNGIKVYEGEVSANALNDEISWVERPDADISSITNGATNESYYLVNSPFTGWVNCDRPVIPDSTFVNFTITVPKGFNSLNTFTYVIFNELNISVSANTFDEPNKQFGFGYVNYSPFPCNEKITVVTVGYRFGQYYYSINKAVVPENMETIPVTLNPASLLEIETKIGAL